MFVVVGASQGGVRTQHVNQTLQEHAIHLQTAGLVHFDHDCLDLFSVQVASLVGIARIKERLNANQFLLVRVMLRVSGVDSSGVT